MNKISVSDFENILKKVVDVLRNDTLKNDADKIVLERLSYELTHSYFNVDVGDMHPMLFEVNIVRRYTFVMNMIAKEIFKYEIANT